MLDCWKSSANDRPTFAEIHKTLYDILHSARQVRADNLIETACNAIIIWEMFWVVLYVHKKMFATVWVDFMKDKCEVFMLTPLHSPNQTEDILWEF